MQSWHGWSIGWGPSTSPGGVTSCGCTLPQRSANQYRGGEAPPLLSNHGHTLQHSGENSQVSSLHEYQLSFLWNVPSGLDRVHPQIPAAGRAPKNRRWVLGNNLTRAAEACSGRREGDNHCSPKSRGPPSHFQTAPSSLPSPAQHLGAPHHFS